MTDPADLPPIEQKVIRFMGHEQSYWTATISLLVFSLALAGFGFSNALSPERRLTAVEAGIDVLGMLGALGVALHMANNRRWLARYSFLLVCGVTALVIVAFVLGPLVTPRDENLLETWDRLIIFLLLTTGGLIAVSMHLTYGGRREPGRTKQELRGEKP